MVKIEVVVTSKEIIMPSNPTPAHFRHFQLSYLDQLNGEIFAPTIYFYTSSPATTSLERSNKLKRSLSETLTKFYPVAGRIRENRYVDCNDKGVEYLETRANCQLSQVLVEQPNLAELNKLLPYADPDAAGNLPLAIQVNFFDCGGIVVGMSFNHKIADACSIVTFTNYWAAVSRGDVSSNVACPRFGLSTLFPPRDIPSYKFGTALENNNVAMTFLFSSSAISSLRFKYATSSSKRPTRVEALSTFIFSRFVAAAGSDRSRRYKVFHMVNLRARLNPPLPDSCFGNLYGYTMFDQVIDMNEKITIEELGYGFLNKMRDAIRKVDFDFVNKFQEQLHLSKLMEEQAAEEEVVRFSFSSISNFPIYEVDFGWGRPIWFSMGKDPLGNTVNFLPTSSGDGGIEAVLKLPEDEMVKLQSDEEFISAVSPTSVAKLWFPSSL